MKIIAAMAATTLAAATGMLADPLIGHVYTDNDLIIMAGDKYATGELPLGDGHYITDAPRKGYIYLCHVMGDEGGAQESGRWIHGNSWNIFQKITVQGNVQWNNAQFAETKEGSQRILSGNGLPLTHATGIFPIQSSDPAYQYDRNPNRIMAQTLHDVLPLNPHYSSTPYCMGGEAGVMLTGVPLFNGFDAGMRDAAAHEVQDGCNGHPQRFGEYHYHSLSSCIKDIGEKTVIGYALDGFPITGPQVAPGKYLTTENLDECHGITSEILLDGQYKITYHYVMTQDFPYSVSCFRGKPVRTGPSDGISHAHRQPPPGALEACNGKGYGTPCQFISPRGDMISGSCRTPPESPLACVPSSLPQ